PDGEFPPNSAAPMRWFLFSSWVMSEDEIGREFEQRVTFSVGGQIFLDTTQSMELQPGKTHHRMVAQVHAFPIAPPGFYNLELFIREKGQEWGDPTAVYPILIQHL